jgi:hypothetical protein
MTPEQFFAAERRKPMTWDSTDCCHTVDRWMRAVTGRSFIEADGRDYATVAEAHNLMLETPLPLLVSRAMRKAGIRMTRSPKVGDIGVLALGSMAVCAVRGARHWLFRTDTGIGAAPLDVRVLGAWDIR